MASKEAVTAYNKISGLDVSATRVDHIIQKEGGRFREYTEGDPLRRLDGMEAPNDTEAFVVSLDGASLAVREPREKAQERKEPLKGSPGSDTDQPKKSRFKNAMVGSYSFYSSKEIDDHGGETIRVPLRTESIYTAKMPEERFTSFKDENRRVITAFHERILPEGGVIKLLIMDGASSLWTHARESQLYDDYDWLLDFYHASEHLSSLSEALFGDAKGGKTAKTWYDGWRRKLRDEEGAIKGLIRSARLYRIKNRLRGERLRKAEQEIGFFTRNQEIMNHAIYYAIGLPIGSGPVEAACKTIVKARMCQSGMRWNRESGGNVLNLRVIKQSGQWDQVWHRYQEEAWDLRAA